MQKILVNNKKHKCQNEEFELDMKVRRIRSIVGDEVTAEKIQYFLRCADGNEQIALNHLFDELEKEKTREWPEPSLEKLLSEIAEEVKCVVCLAYFSDPVSLPCSHTFCSPCLELMVVAETFGKTIKCPLCRASCLLGESGIRGLKPNYYLKNITTKLKSALNTKMCTSCSKSVSTVFCKQCKAFLCDACCSKAHSLSAPAHETIGSEDCFLRKNNNPRLAQAQDLFESDLVIPFNVSKEVCPDLLKAWIRELWFAPTNLQNNIIIQEFKPVMIPYWFYEVDVYSTATYTTPSMNLLGKRVDNSVTRSFKNYLRISELLVCGASSKESAMMSHIEPWKIEQLQPCTLQHLNGADVRPFSFDSEKAWELRALPKVEQLNLEACRDKLQIPQDLSNIQALASYSNKKARRVFCPIYMTTYSYRGQTYLCYINGATAKVYGTRPYSYGKFASLGLTGLGASFGLVTLKNAFN